jgi:hypothetical protein
MTHSYVFKVISLHPVVVSTYSLLVACNVIWLFEAWALFGYGLLSGRNVNRSVLKGFFVLFNWTNLRSESLIEQYLTSVALTGSILLKGRELGSPTKCCDTINVIERLWGVFKFTFEGLQSLNTKSLNEVWSDFILLEPTWAYKMMSMLS